MGPDDEILFGRARDESRSSYDRIIALGRDVTAELKLRAFALSMAEFELHGATLASLHRWYPNEPRVRSALAGWEHLSLQLTAAGVPIILS